MLTPLIYHYSQTFYFFSNNLGKKIPINDIENIRKLHKTIANNKKSLNSLSIKKAPKLYIKYAL